MDKNKILMECQNHSKDAIEIKIEKVSENLSPLSSKFGGHPYKPKGFEIPIVEEEEMLLLAQINLSELPKQNILPNKGILQFYLSNHYGSYGIEDFSGIDKNGFKVVYHKEISNDFQTEFDEIEYEDFPVDAEFKLTFNSKQDLLSPLDLSFEKILKKSLYDFEDEIGEDDVENLYDELINEKSKIGGYPFFTQYDPREYKNGTSEYILLFQMVSEDSIMWGDCGVGNFFIHPEDLKNLNFENVFYNWDCS